MYRAMEGSNAPITTTTPLAAGDAGIRQTVAVMQRLADQGARDPIVRGAVVSAIHHRNLRSHDFVGQARAWFDYVKGAVAFVNDPVNSELVQSPRVTLAVGAGDCDDRATLLAAGLKSIGIPSVFKVVALDRRRPGAFSHVYVEAMIDGRTIAMDPTYPQNRLGDEPRRATRVWRLPAWLTAA